jgi:hypothetical protein
MKALICSCLLAALAAPVAAEPNGAKASSSSFVYLVTGTCLNSPAGFNAKLETNNAGVAWSTTFAGQGSVDGQGAATEVGQSVDTASFGAGPRMHAPAAHAYKATFTAAISGPADDGSVMFHADAMHGVFTAGPYTGQEFGVSGFDLKKAISASGVDVYGSPASPVVQAFALADGRKVERVCVLTVSATMLRQS